MFISWRNTWTLKIIISMYFINGNCLNISTLVFYFQLFYSQQLFEQPHIAASHISFLRSYFENINLEDPHQVVFMDETWVHMNGSESNMWSDDTSQSVKKRRPTTSTMYIILHAGTRNGLVSGTSLIFVSGTKFGRLP
jgi:hypothetical protein